MLNSKRWQSKTALLMVLGMTSATTLPLLTAIPAIAQSEPYQIAQLFPTPSGVVVPAGTIIQTRFEDEDADKIIVTPDETAELTLIVTEDVRSSRGTVVIRAGSRISGELRPYGDGTRFEAEQVVFEGSDRTYEIDATSQVFTQRETISEKSDPDILRGAIIGAAAAAVLAEIFGSIDVIEVLGGAGIGVLGEILLRRDREVEVIVINPTDDLSLRLDSDFVLR